MTSSSGLPEGMLVLRLLTDFDDRTTLLAFLSTFLWFTPALDTRTPANALAGGRDTLYANEQPCKPEM